MLLVASSIPFEDPWGERIILLLLRALQLPRHVVLLSQFSECSGPLKGIPNRPCNLARYGGIVGNLIHCDSAREKGPFAAGSSFCIFAFLLNEIFRLIPLFMVVEQMSEQGGKTHS